MPATAIQEWRFFFQSYDEHTRGNQASHARTCRKGNIVVVTKIDQEHEVRQVLLAFAHSIQERDIVTYEHSRRVATYAQRLARYLGWSRRDARDLALAALVHDLGKTWIANDILNKSEALSAEERLK